ncbi:MAG: L-threonylcarbamoyladenylate synthase [Ruthenibacterium lactatiformans]
MHTCLKQAGAASVAEAARLLRAGEVVGIPTETVYGLRPTPFRTRRCRKYSPKAVHRIILISHIASLDMLPMVVREVPGAAYRLAEAFWPGPLTSYCPAAKRWRTRVRRAGYGVCAYAQPSGGAGGHPRSGVPLAAPSANLSGA